MTKAQARFKFEDSPELSLFARTTPKKVSENDWEISQSQTADKTYGTARKSYTTITRHQEDKLSKATSSLSLPRQDDCKTRMHIK